MADFFLDGRVLPVRWVRVLGHARYNRSDYRHAHGVSSENLIFDRFGEWVGHGLRARGWLDALRETERRAELIYLFR